MLKIYFVYSVEIYTTDLTAPNKRAFKKMSNLRAFDHLMEGVIKNTLRRLKLISARRKQESVQCKLTDYVKFKLKRSGKEYTLMILVPESNLDVQH